MNMRRILVILFAIFIFITALSAKYTPSLTFSSGLNTTQYQALIFPSINSEVEINPLSFRIKYFNFSFPLLFGFVSHSAIVEALRVPSFYYYGIAAEARIEKDDVGFALSFALGNEYYPTERAMLSFFTVKFSPLIKISEYFSLLTPFSYVKTEEGDEFRFNFAMKIGM